MKIPLLIAASLVLACFVTSPVVAEEDSPVFGGVETNKKTALKTAPNAHAAATAMVDANIELRWIRGDRKGNYVRVMVPKGPLGWVLEKNVKKIADPDLSSIALEGSAQPCVTPETLNACTTKKPAGCSPADKLGEGDRVRLVALLSQGKPHANTGESVNCNLKGEEDNDIHIPVTETKNGSEFQSIVVEMIPQDRPDNWTSSQVAKLRGKVLLIEGALFYDNLHFTNADENNPLRGQPKRFSLWEIHPVTSLKICKKPTVTQCNPDRDADWKEF